jgi:hypothetical protein
MKKLKEGLFLGEISDTGEYALFREKALLVVIPEKNTKEILQNHKKIQDAGISIDNYEYEFQGDMSMHVLNESMDKVISLWEKSKGDIEEVLENTSDIMDMEGIVYPTLKIVGQGSIYVSASFKYVSGGECKSDGTILMEELEVQKIESVVKEEEEILPSVLKP